MSFADIQTAYAAHRVATYPLSVDKTPAVKAYNRIGAPHSAQLVSRFPDATAGGFCAGARNKLTVVDIDSPDDRLVDEIQARFGATPLHVRTPSGGRHLYYRHAGEARRIKPLPDVDVLGGGNVVAALSVVPKGRYDLERGTLDVLDTLPRMQGSAQLRVDHRANLQAPIATAINHGERNSALFRLALPMAAGLTSEDELLDLLRQANRELANPPNDDAEVVRTARKVWQYKTENRLFVPGQAQRLVLVASIFSRLAADGQADGALLLLVLRQAHGNTTDPFAISPGGMVEAGKIGSWNKQRYRSAIRTLLDYRAIRLVKMGGRGKHDPSLFAFTASCLGD